jgi:hypothetical protein
VDDQESQQVPKLEIHQAIKMDQNFVPKEYKFLENQKIQS